MATWPAACSTSGSPCSIDVSGTTRTYYLYLPTNYDAAQQYPLVFQFHPRGGTAQQAINIPNIRSSFTAIYVTPQGLTASGSTGWPNTNGQDIALTKALIAAVESEYCVDKTRIFSTGFSYGGMMSFAIGCEMGDVFRAIAPMSGALYSGCKSGTHSVAMWGSHGVSDSVVPIADGRAGRDAILSRNQCGTQTTATTPSPCVSYSGCAAGAPTTWCEFEGDHAPPSFAASAIATFFKQF
jgi:poly(3-hydroxybutyrate) depolymerase